MRLQGGCVSALQCPARKGRQCHVVHEQCLAECGIPRALGIFLRLICSECSRVEDEGKSREADASITAQLANNTETLRFSIPF